MFLLDVNILVAAAVEDHAFHKPAYAWLVEKINDLEAEIIVPDLVWVGFLRVATTPAATNGCPMSLVDATLFMHAVRVSHAYRGVNEVPQNITHFFDFCRDNNAKGKLVPDAYIASIAKYFSCPVVTFDRDFRKFDGIEVVELAA